MEYWKLDGLKWRDFPAARTAEELFGQLHAVLYVLEDSEAATALIQRYGDERWADGWSDGREAGWEAGYESARCAVDDGYDL